MPDLFSVLSLAIIFEYGCIFGNIDFFRRQVIDLNVTIFSLILDFYQFGGRLRSWDVIIHFFIDPVVSVSLVDINSSWLYFSIVSIFTSLSVVVGLGLRLHLLEICADSLLDSFGIVRYTTCPALNSYFCNLGPSGFQSLLLVSAKQFVWWNLKSKIFLAVQLMEVVLNLHSDLLL